MSFIKLKSYVNFSPMDTGHQESSEIEYDRLTRVFDTKVPKQEKVAPP